MNNTVKKIVVSVTALACALWMVGTPASAALTESQIQSILDLLASFGADTATVANVESALTGGPVTPTTPTVAGCTITSFDRNLKQGMSGDDVKCLQIVLNSNSATQVAASGVGSSGNETSYFGPLTKAAVIKFQEKYASEVLAVYGLTTGTGFVGSTTRAKLNTLLTAGAAEEEEEAAEETGAPLTVALTSDTPAGTLLLAGSANNTVTKVTFFGAADTATTITGLTIKSYGTANLGAADIARIKVFDGTIQIGLTQIQVNGISTFTFAPGISIPAGGSKTLSIAVDIAATGVATPSATVKMGLEVATSIMGATFTGTFPIVGNAFTIVAGGAIGVVNVTAGSPVPYNLVSIGTKDLPLGNFIVTAGTNEDVKITQFNTSYGGAANASTCQDSDVTNVRVKVDGVLTGTSASFATRRATIDFTTPITITKGTSKIFQVIGDIVGAGRIIELSCEAGSIFGVGSVSGAGVSGPAARFNLGAVNAIAFGPGNLAVSVSTASPAGSKANVVISITPQVLGVFDVRAVGEDVLINTVNLQLVETSGTLVAAAAETINNVGLYNEAGSLLSNQITFNEASLAPAAGDLTAPITQTFALNWLVPGNTTQRLYVKGTTNGLAPPAAYVINAQLALVAGSSIVGTGMSSAGQAGPNNILSTSVLGLPALTVNAAATFLAVADPTSSKYNQAFIAPAAQAPLGYLKITAQREDQDYRDMVLTATITGTAADLRNLVSGVALFEGTTQVTQFVAPGFDANGAGGIVGGEWNLIRFATTDTITPVTFSVGVPRTFTIAANLLTQVTQDNDVTWDINPVATAGALDTGLQTLGKTSGVVASNGVTAIALRTNVGAYNETGTYDLRTNVLEIKKAAISPTGNVRGTFQNHAIFDLDATGSAANLDVEAITFTSTVGLPGAAAAAMFRLFNYTNGTVIPATVTVNAGLGTVTFSGIAAGNCRVTAGSTLQIALQVTTTNTGVWLINSQIQWGILTQASVTVGANGQLLVLGDPDVGTAYIAANALVMMTNIDANGVFNYGVDGLYWDINGSGTPVAAGDQRLAIGNAAASGLGYTVGSIVAADTDAGTALVAVDALVVITNVDANAVYNYGVDALYHDTTGTGTPTAVGDRRVVCGGTLAEGLDWQGEVGYGGVTVSIPAVANTVLLP